MSLLVDLLLTIHNEQMDCWRAIAVIQFSAAIDSKLLVQVNTVAEVGIAILHPLLFVLMFTGFFLGNCGDQNKGLHRFSNQPSDAIQYTNHYQVYVTMIHQPVATNHY